MGGTDEYILHTAQTDRRQGCARLTAYLLRGVMAGGEGVVWCGVVWC